MAKLEASDLFNEKMAANYDKGRLDLQTMKDTMYLYMRGAFADLPDEATILVVGAGTGEDILYMAKHRPNWRYTVVEPAPAMMAICRDKIEGSGLTERCSFHDGYLDSFESESLHTAAVSVLVSQFVTDQEGRTHFFREIRRRLVPGGLFYTADLLIDRDATSAETLLNVWFTLLSSSEIPAEQLEKMKRFEGVWLMPHKDYAALLQEAGFIAPVQLYQAGLITSWITQS